MWTWLFWKQALERAVKTAAQVAAAYLATTAVDILTLDWRALGSLVLAAVLASILTSVATSDTVGPAGSPSMVAVTPPARRVAPTEHPARRYPDLGP